MMVSTVRGECEKVGGAGVCDEHNQTRSKAEIQNDQCQRSSDGAYSGSCVPSSPSVMPGGGHSHDDAAPSGVRVSREAHSPLHVHCTFRNSPWRALSDSRIVHLTEECRSEEDRKSTRLNSSHQII